MNNITWKRNAVAHTWFDESTGCYLLHKGTDMWWFDTTEPGVNRNVKYDKYDAHAPQEPVEHQPSLFVVFSQLNYWTWPTCWKEHFRFSFTRRRVCYDAYLGFLHRAQCSLLQSQNDLNVQNISEISQSQATKLQHGDN